MSNAQILAENIKNIAKSKNVTLKSMLLDCDLNVNTLNQISDKKGISCFGLERIADYLGVSVDYLLGRTKEPQKINYGVENHGDNNGAINNQVNSTNTSDRISKEMLVKFEELNFTDKVKVMSLIAELSQKE